MNSMETYILSLRERDHVWQTKARIPSSDENAVDKAFSNPGTDEKIILMLEMVWKDITCNQCQINIFDNFVLYCHRYGKAIIVEH